LHAGFLERARTLYTEILRRKPRNPKVLKELGVVYENMHLYSKVKEIIQPLRLLGEETEPLEHFLYFLQIKEDKHLSIAQKIKKFKTLLQKDPTLYRPIITQLLQLDTKSAWENIDPTHLEKILDILWSLPFSQLDLDIISNNKTLRTLYYAKGYLDTKSTQSGHFALDMLAIARQSGFNKGDLQFSYLCNKCKQSFPASFMRCPNCMAINSVKVEAHIAKTSTETNHSLL